MKRNIHLAFLTVSILCFASGFSLYQNTTDNSKKLVISGQLPEYSNEQLASTSPLIVEGIVEALGNSKWNTSNEQEPAEIQFTDMVYHDVTIKVIKVLKGANYDYVKVRVYEGELPDGKNIKAVESEGSPEFSVNESVLLFLDYDDTSYKKANDGDHFITRGMFQGKWTIDNNEVVFNKKNTVSKQELLEVVSKYKDYKWPEPKQPKSREQ